MELCVHVNMTIPYGHGGNLEGSLPALKMNYKAHHEPQVLRGGVAKCIQHWLCHVWIGLLKVGVKSGPWNAPG